MEDDRGRSTADTFNNIKKMELGASTIVTSGIELSQVQELQQMTEKQILLIALYFSFQ